MKKIIGLILAIVFMASVAHAGSCVKSGSENIWVDGKIARKYITLTCTGDGSITAYSFSPATFDVRGWYLYNVSTNPGTAPTAAYDITLVVDSEDIAGGLLADRSASATETVAIAATTKGYHMADGIMSITFANNTANPSVIVMTLRFTTN